LELIGCLVEATGVTKIFIGNSGAVVTEEWALDSFEDIEKSDVLRRSCKSHASACPSARFEDSSAHKLRHDFCRVSGTFAQCLGKLPGSGQALAVAVS
jgi:hypothetical protein